MKDSEKLGIYNQLREAHRYIRVLETEEMDEIDRVAIEAVDYVLYLAEGHFARMGDPAAAARTLGSIKSGRKAIAVRENGKLGGRPRKPTTE